MTSKISFDDAARSLLDAAVDPTRWPLAMDLMARYAGAVGTVLLPVKGRGPGTPHSESLAEGLDTYFRDGWHLRDERTRGLPLLRTKSVFTDQDFASPEEIAGSDYYRGFLAKYHVNWSAVVGFTDPDDEWCLVFERGDRQGFFDEREQADLARFAAPLGQAAALARSVAYANAASALDAYQSIGCASFLIGRTGRVERYNEQAQRLLGDGLDLSHGVLRCSHAPDNAALAELIAARGTAPAAAAEAPIAIVHRPLKRPLIVRAVALTGLARSVFSPSAMILLVSDAGQRPPSTQAEALSKAFRLTTTEAALVAHLEQDIALQDAAELMAITFETARTHLKRVLAKTETRRQQDLLTLLRRLRP